MLSFLKHMNTVVSFVRLTWQPVGKIALFSTDPLKYFCVVYTVEAIPSPIASHKNAKKLVLIYIIDSYKIGLFQFTVGLGCTKCLNVPFMEITATVIVFPVLLTASIYNVMYRE